MSQVRVRKNLGKEVYIRSSWDKWKIDDDYPRNNLWCDINREMSVGIIRFLNLYVSTSGCDIIFCSICRSPFPKIIVNLSSLNEFYINDNLLTSLPETFGNLTSLA